LKILSTTGQGYHLGDSRIGAVTNPKIAVRMT